MEFTRILSTTCLQKLLFRVLFPLTLNFSSCFKFLRGMSNVIWSPIEYEPRHWNVKNSGSSLSSKIKKTYFKIKSKVKGWYYYQKYQAVLYLHEVCLFELCLTRNQSAKLNWPFKGTVFVITRNTHVSTM